MWNVLGKYHCCFSSKEKAENRVEKESETSKLCTISLLKGDSTTVGYIYHCDLKTRSFWLKFAWNPP